jgi:hypothetical protein
MHLTSLRNAALQAPRTKVTRTATIQHSNPSLKFLQSRDKRMMGLSDILFALQRKQLKHLSLRRRNQTLKKRNRGVFMTMSVLTASRNVSSFIGHRSSHSSRAERMMLVRRGTKTTYGLTRLVLFFSILNTAFI